MCRITIRSIFLSFALLSGEIHAEETFQLFAYEHSGVTLLTLDYSNYIHVGSYMKQSSIRTNLGFDFPLFSVSPLKKKKYSLGVNALLHMYLFPEKRIFHFDNFYVLSAIYFEGKEAENLTWRFYPFHHCSAHLADGYTYSNHVSESTGYIETDSKKVSYSMLYGAVCYKPFLGLETEIGAGYYVHTTSRKHLRGRVDFNCLFISPLEILIVPFICVKNEFIYEEKIRYGFEVACGAFFQNNSHRGLCLSFKYINKPHPGQYWGKKEKGGGLDIRFIL